VKKPLTTLQKALSRLLGEPLHSPNTNEKSLSKCSVVEAFEPRLLFSADLSALGLSLENSGGQAVAEQASAQNHQILQSNAQAQSNLSNTDQSAAPPIELVVLDSRVEDQSVLLADIEQQISKGRRVELLHVGIDSDGLELMSRAMADYAVNGVQISAVHIVSHGNDGEFQLGNQRVNQAALRENANEISSWSIALTDNADLLIYGCNFAGSNEGRLLAESLAAITGADVAGNQDKTGFAGLGGDWQLEVTTGVIESAVIAAEQTTLNWHHLLEIQPITAPSRVNSLASGNQSTGLDINSLQIEDESSGGRKVSVDANGNYVVVWADETSVKIRFFEANGTPTSGSLSPAILSVGSVQTQPAIAMNAAGQSVMVWTEVNGTLSTVMAQRYDAVSHFPIGIPFVVSTFPYCAKPSVAINDAGQFGIAFEHQDASGNISIVVRGFNWNLAPLSAAMVANSAASNENLRPSIAIRGNLAALVWHDADQSSGRIVVRTFDITTGVFSAEWNAVTNTSFSNYGAPDIAIARNNDLIVAWQAENNGVMNTRYTVLERSGGSFITIRPDSPVNTDASENHSLPKIATSENGEFFIAQQSANHPIDGSGWGVFARHFDAAGNEIPPGNESALSYIDSQIDNTFMDQFAPNIASRNGSIIAVWTSAQNGDLDVFARQFGTQSENILIVDTALDVIDGNVSSFNNFQNFKGSDGKTSLAEAILVANNSPNINGQLDRIIFNIPQTAGGHDIVLSDALPAITEAVDISGGSQFDFDGGQVRIISTLAGQFAVLHLVGAPLQPMSSFSIISDIAIQTETGDGIVVESSGNEINQNNITSTTGSGIRISGVATQNASNNTLSNNYIYDNAQFGIDINSSSANSVVNNTLTTNQNAGIRITSESPSNNSQGNTLDNNVVGLSPSGIVLTGDGTIANIITNNKIGLNRTLTPIANFDHGILISAGASNNQIGGVRSDEGNQIANTMMGGGVMVDRSGLTAASGNSILSNALSNNAGAGISHLPASAVNAPVIQGVASDGSTTQIVGALSAAPNTHYRIEYFKNSPANLANPAQGEILIGAIYVETDGLGIASIKETLLVGVAAGFTVTSTATQTNASYNLFGETSNFSQPRTAGLYSKQLENETGLFNIAGFTQNPNRPNLVYTLETVGDPAKFTLTPEGVLGFSSNPNYEAMPSDPQGGYDYSWWAVVKISDSLGYVDYVTHMFDFVDANDAPIVSSGDPQTTAQGSLITFTGVNAIQINDPDQGIAAENAVMSITVSSEIDGVGDASGIVTLHNASAFSVTTSGTLAQINGYLANMTLQAAAGETRALRLVVTVNDNGSGFVSAPNLTASGFQTISFIPANISPNIGNLPPNIIYVENSAAQRIFSAVTLSDSDSPNLTSLVLSYSRPLTPEETLNFPFLNTLGPLTANLNLATNSYSITGPLGVNFYESLFQSITFENSAQIPGADLVFSLQISDGQNSVTKVTTLKQRPVNDPPVISFSASSFNTPFATPFAFNQGVSQALFMADPDVVAGAAPFILSIAIPNQAQSGTLNFNTAQMQLLQNSGLAVMYNSAMPGQMLMQGNLEQLSQAVALLVYEPNPLHSGIENVNFILDDAGNIGGGNRLSSAASISIQTAANTAPIISGITGTYAYIENSGINYPFANLQIGDAEQNIMSGASIELASGFDYSQDIAPNFVNVPGGIQGLWTRNILYLTGNFPIADYVTAIRSITFENTSDTPSNSPRVFQLTVSDGLATSVGNQWVTIQAIDDLPELVVPAELYLPFGQSITLNNLNGDLFLTDIDAGTQVHELTLSVSDGLISLDSTAGITVRGGNTAGDVEIKIRGSISALNVALQNYIQFTASPAFTGATLSFLLEAVDPSSGLTLPAALAQDSSAIIGLAGTPIQIIDGSSKASFAENSAPAVLNPDVQLIGGNTGSIAFIDVQIIQNFEPAADLLSVTKLSGNLTSLWDPMMGRLRISGAGNLTEFVLALQSVDFMSLSENPSVLVREVSVTVYDGLQFSAVHLTSVVVESLNDAPQIFAFTSFSALEDTPARPLDEVKNLVADVDSNQLVLNLSISTGTMAWIGTALPPQGVVFIGNQSVSLSGNVTDINLWATQLQFLAPENFSGLSELSWSLTDEHGASTIQTTTLNIAPVNDAPSWQGNQALGLVPNATITLNVGESNAFDVDDAAAQLNYVLTSLPTAGTLLFDDVAISLSSTFTQADLNRGAIKYKHTNAAMASDSFTFFVKDQAGAQTAINRMNFNINAAPVVIINTGGGGTPGAGGVTPSGGGGTTSITPPPSTTSIVDVKSSPGSEGNTGTAITPPTSASANTNTPQKTVTKSNGIVGISANASSSDIGQSQNGGYAPQTSALNRMGDAFLAESAKNASANTQAYAKVDIARADAALGLGQFGNRSQSENTEYAAIIRASLNNQAFTQDIQKARNDAENSIRLDKNVVASTTAVTTTLSIGYVIWLVRGGALLSSLLAALPAWRAVDPLPILGTMAENEEDQDDDSLDAMIEKAKASREVKDEVKDDLMPKYLPEMSTANV
jgi:parallel beta-helix repeat protein